MRVSSILLLVIIAMLPPAAAQKASEWDAFRFTDYDREVAAGLREVQQLLQGRESLVQSYENTDQSQIETERAIEKLYQDRINTQKSALSYYEDRVNFKFPSPASEDTLELTTHADPTEDAEIQLWMNQMENTLKSYSPPQPIPSLFRIRSLSETADGISVEIENLGDPIDALISVADTQTTIIGTPYHVSLKDWDDPRIVSFQWLSHSDKIQLLIQEASGKSYRIPLFIREQVASPRIVAFPLEQTAKIGESAEYTLVIEGDAKDRQRYPIEISNLPTGIAWQIAKVIPAATEGGQPRSVAIRTVQFSQAFSRHEFALQLTLSRDLPKALIGKPIPFTLRLGSIRETLSITPIGVGEITVGVPAVVQIRLGESKQIPLDLQNIGTETVSGIEIRSAGTLYGVEIKAGGTIALVADERREVPVTVSIAFDASVGQREVQLVVSSSAGSHTANLRVEIQPKGMGFALLSGLTTPALITLAICIAIYAGVKGQQWRQRRAQEKAESYDLDLPAAEAGGDD